MQNELCAGFLHNEIALYCSDEHKDIPRLPFPKSVPEERFREFTDVVIRMDIVLGEGCDDAGAARDVVVEYLRADLDGDADVNTAGQPGAEGAGVSQLEGGKGEQLVNLLAGLGLGGRQGAGQEANLGDDGMDLS